MVSQYKGVRRLVYASEKGKSHQKQCSAAVGIASVRGLHFGQLRKSAENGVLDNEVLVNQSVAHAELIAAFKRAEADAAHKFGIIKTVANKGPKAIAVAVEVAAKAAKRRDSFAKKLADLGVDPKD